MMTSPKHDPDIFNNVEEDASLGEGDGLLGRRQTPSQCHPWRSILAAHITILYIIILSLFGAVVGLSVTLIVSNIGQEIFDTETAPVNDIVRYKTVTFDPFFLGHESPWTRGPKEVKDRLWDATYEFGISGITKDEASNLLNETLPSPHDPDTYMIQLEVFHNLHCLNMLRKTLYPDQYPEMWAYHDNGTVNHGTLQSLHMDHCIDALRQSTMCESDITPIRFVNNYFGRGVFPDLVATHTCRDFDAIVEWAKEHEVKGYTGH
ncbi:hypothetical protein PISL3812_06641 [Talaromyces islandicus]|uniref:Cyclochlorotine biosynthesis protein O n=1 Tax=Talaromyces islandicus TaxID=28573 RepID=A0A0U1M1Z4_TALIS|nr:hypothetical protein PISL3812_06641 [Talaromyces islandicus]